MPMTAGFNRDKGWIHLSECGCADIGQNNGELRGHHRKSDSKSPRSHPWRQYQQQGLGNLVGSRHHRRTVTQRVRVTRATQEKRIVKKYDFLLRPRHFIVVESYNPRVLRFILSLRMASKRFARLSNGFSKRLENHVAAVSL
jgi:hypothetical protein